jgi:hypothetical protein
VVGKAAEHDQTELKTSPPPIRTVFKPYTNKSNNPKWSMISYKY